MIGLTGRSDSSSSLDAVYDGLHGYIALDDENEHREQIRSLLSAKVLQRLRRVKQLGFVSQSFLSAEHNRYAHALGTMHMMRRLLDRLQHPETEPDRFWSAVISDVCGAFPSLKSALSVERKEVLFQHLLVAALLQDAGEYPYAKATERFFKPAESVKLSLRSRFGPQVEIISSNKALMTLALVFEVKETKDLIAGLDDALLAFLLSGLLREKTERTAGLTILRHMLDGAIDADRLDYVYRDAYHTLGDKGTATPLIDSLVTYDENGPVLKHVRPIIEFLSKRALLWSTVYHSPENRFRVILLRKVFQALAGNENLARRVQQDGLFSHTPHTYLDFDDRRVERIIDTLADVRETLDLHPDVKTALEFLSDGASRYEYQWVPFSLEKDCDLSPRDDVLPASFYFDRYADYQDHSLYDQGSIRLAGSRYRIHDGTPSDGIVQLENCVGPFSAVLLSAKWSSLPMPNHIAWFQPAIREQRDGPAWEKLERFKLGEHDPELQGQFVRSDPMLDAEIGFDARDEGSVQGNIFISFRWTDYRTVYRIAEILKRRQRRYYNLGGDYIGIGGTIVSNSRAAVREADAIIMVYSHDYAERYRKFNDTGAISAEVHEMIKRVPKLPIAVLSLEPFASLEERLPWNDLGFSGGVPAIGLPIRNISNDTLQRIVLDALKFIDRKLETAK
jgi:HD superfamily phosphohydrolase